jgi:cysteine-rich repeat protein
VCGDGDVEGTEECDDGNTTAGDGCSDTCTSEVLPPVCGDGAIAGTEECDDGNATAGDGCSDACAVEAGYLCSGEPSTCVLRDGTCAAPFALALTDNAGTLEGTGTGDTTGGTSQVAAGPCDGYTSGAGPDHIYELTIPDARDVTITITDATVFDSVLRLLAMPCELASEIVEPGDTEGCSDSGFAMAAESLSYVALPAGTYYVVVDGYDDAELGAYTLTVAAAATQCGDATLDGAEACDDGNMTAGDGCSSTCTVESGYLCTGEPSVCMFVCGNGLIDGAGEECDDGNATAGDGCSTACTVEAGYACTGEPSVCVLACGNGLLDAAGEECDDGNTTAGDRCSATCTLESDVTEVEPNDTVAQALAAGSHIIRGAIEPAGDVDLYTFTLDAPSEVNLETYTTIDGDLTNHDGLGTLGPLVDCASDTYVRLFDAAGDVTDNTTAIASDDDDGDGTCSFLGPSEDPATLLQPGTYTIKVTTFSASDTAPVYILDLAITQ